MLVCYARELKEHFVEYAEETVRLMVRQEAVENFVFPKEIDTKKVDENEL